MNKENNRLFLNGKSVPLFNLSALLKGYNPAKEDDIWFDGYLDNEEEQTKVCSFFVCNAIAQTIARMRATEDVGSVERPSDDNCLYVSFGSGSEQKWTYKQLS